MNVAVAKIGKSIEPDSRLMVGRAEGSEGTGSDS